MAAAGVTAAMPRAAAPTMSAAMLGKARLCGEEDADEQTDDDAHEERNAEPRHGNSLLEVNTRHPTDARYPIPAV